MAERKRSLMFHGIALFLLGLLVGLVEQRFNNPRMGLSAHLEGLMNGTFLLALGAAWPEGRLSPRASRTAYVGFLYGGYTNLVMTTLAAIWGTSSMTPLTGKRGALAWQEALVTTGFTSVGVTMIVASGVVLWGFRRHTKAG